MIRNKKSLQILLLFVILVSFFTICFRFFVFPVHATTYFSDDFESFPSASWSITAITGTFNKSSNVAHGGSYSGWCYSISSTYTAYGTATFTQTGANDHHLKIWIYINSSYTGENAFLVSELGDGSHWGMIDTIKYHDSAWWLQAHNGVSYVDVCTATADTWHSWEGYYNYSSGKVHYYLDGVKQGGDWSTYSGASVKPNQDILGDTSNTAGVGNGYVYFDDMAIDNTAEPVADSTPPTYSSPATSTTIAGASCNFTVTLSDNVALANYTFGTNNTGPWTNDSKVNISGATYSAGVIKTLNTTVGQVVQWEYWFADTSNNLNNTGIQSLTITADNVIPTYTNPLTNTTKSGASCNFTVSLADNAALANYTFGTNNTGTWTNDTKVNISGTSYSAGTAKTLNNTVGQVVQWEYWFADTSNNLNNTGIQSLTIIANPGTDTLANDLTVLYASSATNWQDSVQTNYIGYLFNNRTLVQLQNAIDALRYTSNASTFGWIDAYTSWQAVLYWYSTCAKYGIENQTTIEWALDNATMMPNGLPVSLLDPVFGTGKDCFLVYNRFLFYGYYYAQKYNYELAKWNATAAYNALANVTNYGHIPILEVTNDTVGHDDLTRQYDETGETMDCFTALYAICGVTAAKTSAENAWNYAYSNYYGNWSTSFGAYFYYSPGLGDHLFECESPGFLQTVEKLYWYDSSISNTSSIITDIETRFLSYEWDSPMWTWANQTGTQGMVMHAKNKDGTAYNSQDRLQNTIMAWSAIYGISNSLSGSDISKINDMLQGTGSTSSIPAWNMTYKYGGASGFKWMSDSASVTPEATAAGMSLMALQGVDPINTSIAIPLQESCYEQIDNLQDHDIFNINLANCTINVGLTGSGTVTFLYGSSPVNYTFTNGRGVYQICFAGDWNSILSVTYTGALPTGRIYLFQFSQNSGCSVSNLDSGNLLAKYRYYNWDVKVSDPSGYTDLISVDLNFSTSASAYDYGVRYNQTTNTFSVLGTANGTYFSIGTSSNASSGTWANLTFTIMYDWNYPYTSLNAIVVSINSVLQISQTNYTLNYPLVETVQTTTPSPLHTRMNIGASDSVSGTLQYGGTSVTIPDAEISSVAVHDASHNSKGTESNAASYNVAFTLLTAVANNAYHISVTGTDGNFPNGDLGSSTFNVISDEVTITITNSITGRVNINANATGISATATYDYDGAAYGGTLTWNDTTFVMSSAVQKYFAVSSISGDSYGITTIRSINPNSTSVIWDSVTIALSGPSNARINLAANATGIIGTATYDYDGVAFGGSLTWNDTTFVMSFATEKYFNVSSISGGTYGITIIRSTNPNSTSEIWDRVAVTLVANSTSPASGVYIMVNVSATYAYDGVSISSWSFNVLRNGTHFASDNFTDHASGITYQYTTENVTETLYGLTAFSSNTVTVTWGSVGSVWSWTLTPIDVDGNALSNVRVNISQSGTILYSNTTMPWTLNVSPGTYNVTVTWIQNLLVNSTLNMNIAGDTTSNFTCLAYPYTISGVRYWAASNNTITSTSNSSDSITINYMTTLLFGEEFDGSTYPANWWTAYGSPALNPSGQLEMTSVAGGRCALATIPAIYLTLPDKYTVAFRLKVDQFGSSGGQQQLGIYDTDYWIPFSIFSNYIAAGTSNFTTVTDNNWHTWTLVCDHTGSTFDVYRDGIKLASLSYVASSGLLFKVSLDGFGGNSTNTIAHLDWIQIYSGLNPPLPDSILVSSCPTNPTYILGDAYDETTCYDPYGYAVLNSTGTMSITISYANWGGLSVSMTDHALNSVASVAYGDLNINASGTTGDFGHIQIECAGKGNPWDTGTLATSYAGTTLTGTYIFTDNSMSFLIRWYFPSAPNPNNPGNPGINLPNLPTNLFANVVLSFPTYAQPGSTVNGTLNVTWSGYQSLYLWSVSLNSGYRNWTLNMEALPVLLQGFAHQSLEGLDGEVSIPVTLTIPTGTELNGTQQIPCTVMVQTSGGSGKAIRAYISLELVGLSAQIPNWMTYGFVALVVGALITMPLFMRSKKKKKQKK